VICILAPNVLIINQLHKLRQNSDRTSINALSGHRLFSTFGFVLPKQTKKESSLKVSADYEEYHYDQRLCDWIEGRTQEKLTEYIPNANIHYLLENCIERELC